MVGSVRLVTLFVLGLLLSFPLMAQDEVDPLLEMLRAVPDHPQTRAGVPLISYADYRAFESARGLVTPLTEESFFDSDEVDLWIAATNGLVSGFPITSFLEYLNGMRDAVGFGWFDVDRALTFGAPPSTGNILAGEYDALAIAGAFEARGYTAEKRSNLTVWCAAAGCDAGMNVNIASRNRANPFGGQLGREEPIAVLPDAVLNSPDSAVLNAMIDAVQGTQPSLADDPEMQMIVSMLADQGTLRQIQIYDGASIGTALEGFDAPQSDQTGALPAYSLIYFADTFREDTEIALIGLVYRDAQLAQIAAETLYQNVETAYSSVATMRLLDLIEERGGEITGVTVQENPNNGIAVAVLEIRSAMPANEEVDGRIPFSGQVFRLLINAVFSRDVFWLRSE